MPILGVVASSIVKTKDFELIGGQIISSTTTSLTYNISQSYSHLLLQGSARVNNNNTNGGFTLRWNGGSSTDTSYIVQQMYKTTSTTTYGNGSVQASNTNGFPVFACGNLATAGTYGHFRVLIPTYKDTDKFRAGIQNCGYDCNTVNNGSLDDGTITQRAATSNTTSALTSITLYTADGFLSGSRFQLYGVK